MQRVAVKETVIRVNWTLLNDRLDLGKVFRGKSNLFFPPLSSASVLSDVDPTPWADPEARSLLWLQVWLPFSIPGWGSSNISALLLSCPVVKDECRGRRISPSLFHSRRVVTLAREECRGSLRKRQ